MSLLTPKRKVFVSFYQGDRDEVHAFVDRWANGGKVFIPKALGVSMDDGFINSTNPEYVMSQIRQQYLSDSTVTIVLVGSCTHSRRYVDWELKTSLRCGSFTPNGVMGIILPRQGDRAHLPPRLAANWDENNSDCYARYWVAPTSASQLADWIEDAHSARTSRAYLIRNRADMMKYNSRCQIHGVTH